MYSYIFVFILLVSMFSDGCIGVFTSNFKVNNTGEFNNYVSWVDYSVPTPTENVNIFGPNSYCYSHSYVNTVNQINIGSNLTKSSNVTFRMFENASMNTTSGIYVNADAMFIINGSTVIGDVNVQSFGTLLTQNWSNFYVYNNFDNIKVSQFGIAQIGGWTKINNFYNGGNNTQFSGERIFINSFANYPPYENLKFVNANIKFQNVFQSTLGDINFKNSNISFNTSVETYSVNYFSNNSRFYFLPTTYSYFNGGSFNLVNSELNLNNTIMDVVGTKFDVDISSINANDGSVYFTDNHAKLNHSGFISKSSDIRFTNVSIDFNNSFFKLHTNNFEGTKLKLNIKECVGCEIVGPVLNIYHSNIVVDSRSTLNISGYTRLENTSFDLMGMSTLVSSSDITMQGNFNIDDSTLQLSKFIFSHTGSLTSTNAWMNFKSNQVILDTVTINKTLIDIDLVNLIFKGPSSFNEVVFKSNDRNSIDFGLMNIVSLSDCEFRVTTHEIPQTVLIGNGTTVYGKNIFMDSVLISVDTLLINSNFTYATIGNQSHVTLDGDSSEVFNILIIYGALSTRPINFTTNSLGLMEGSEFYMNGTNLFNSKPLKNQGTIVVFGKSFIRDSLVNNGTLKITQTLQINKNFENLHQTILYISAPNVHSSLIVNSANLNGTIIIDVHPSNYNNEFSLITFSQPPNGSFESVRFTSLNSEFNLNLQSCASYRLTPTSFVANLTNCIVPTPPPTTSTTGTTATTTSATSITTSTTSTTGTTTGTTTSTTSTTSTITTDDTTGIGSSSSLTPIVLLVLSSVLINLLFNSM